MDKAAKSFRCAIYTRVSSDSGLDQEFNSLDAQRQAAEAFIQSQAHEGWQLSPAAYDDGGFSGGSVVRPALQKLLEDINAKLVDIVVVYKVDRLTRSLMDFVRLVELFDQNNVSFVSVTQAFNTTTSMGRLTLNVLLSFAQFEREVTAERIRDKFMASKKKGLWMGGNVPLGYRVSNRKLIIAEDEAATVKMIFQRYAELGSAIQLVENLRHQGVKTRVRNLTNGKTTGGVPFTVGPLLYMLKNRVYVGEVDYRGKIYPGDHQPILDREVFEAVQAKLAANLVAGPGRQPIPALLVGRIIDDRGNIMTPTHSRRGPRRYPYYVSRAFIEGRKHEAGSVPRIAAQDIEPIILSTLMRLVPASTNVDIRPEQLIEKYVKRVTIVKDRIDIELMAEFAEQFGPVLEIPWKRKPGRPKREILFSDAGGEDRPIKIEARKSLVRGIALGRRWLHELQTVKVASVEEIAAREGRTERSINMTLSLAFLAPDIVAAAVSGRLPRGIGATSLTEMPPLWSDQRATLSKAV
jgi:site-specific DNA recombinase